MISWIKLDINILDDAKIKIIRSHPDGDSVVLLWIGILCLAMKSTRPGTIEISDGLPYTVDDLANLFNLEKKTVEMGLVLFTKYRMIEIFEGGSIEVINFSKHQKLEEIEHKRELTRIRVLKHRAKLRQCNALLTHDSVTVTPTDKTKTKTKTKTKRRDIGAIKRSPTLSDDEFIEKLRSNPAYKELDIRNLYQKMVVWCEVNGQKPTRRRFVNWLNREETTMTVKGGNGSGSRHRSEPIGTATIPEYKPEAVPVISEEQRRANLARVQNLLKNTG